MNQSDLYDKPKRNGKDKRMTLEEFNKKFLDAFADAMMISVEDISDEKNVIEDLGADDLDTVELVMAFEDEFQIACEEEECAKCKTVGDYKRMVIEKFKGSIEG